MRGRLVLPCLSPGQIPRLDASQTRQAQGGCTPATARSQATAACPQGCAAAPVRPSRPHRAPWTAVAPPWRREARLTATSVAVGEPLEFVPTETKRDAGTPQGATASRSMCRRQRCKRLGPGSRRVCADVRLPRKVWIRHRASSVASRPFYASLRFGRSLWVVACGLVGPCTE